MSILGASTPSIGEGGGVISNSPCRPARAIIFGSDGSGDNEVDPCDLLTFFVGCSSVCTFEIEGERRVEFGR